MANLVKMNPQVLQKWRKQGEGNFYFFERFILNDADLTPTLHKPLCDFLQCPPTLRQLICAFRGSLKSSVLRAFMLWKGLYIIDWSWFLIEQKLENAIAHHEMMQNKFLYGARASLLQDMFKDRLPSDFPACWTQKRTLLVREDPNAEMFVTVGSLDSKLEGGHKSGIACDDLEGADADVSDVPNRDSKRFINERAEPLLKEPAQGHIIVAGTPHGDDPVVYELKGLPGWSHWWEPIVDASGQTKWPQRFPQEWVETKKAAAQVSATVRRMWDMQYQLRKGSVATKSFDMERIRENFYTIEGGRLIRYPNKRNADGTLEYAHIDLSHCRFYMHGDPGHRGPQERINDKRPSMWAWVVCAVAPDFHVFVLETFIADVALDLYAEAFFRLYRKWAPFEFSFESVGAQSWFKHHLELLETTKFRRATALPHPWNPTGRVLPRPSSRMQEFSKGTQDKEAFIVHELELWHNMGWLHLHESQDELLREHEHFGNQEIPLDGIDALAQGPSLWKPPMSPEAIRSAKRRQDELRAIRLAAPVGGGYTPPRQASMFG